MLEIREVKTQKEIKLFATYPVKLYKDCKYYVPSLRSDEMNTLNPKKNFNLAGNECKAFLCFKDNEVVGRIVGILNKCENSKGTTKYIRFSRLECIDDIDVFKALLGAVENYGKENGAEIIHGPWGFNDTDREGMLTYGFDKRSTYVTNYYYPYFCKRMVELGFQDESKWVERKFDLPDEPYDRITTMVNKLKHKLKVRDITEEYNEKQTVEKYGLKWFDTLNESYGNLDGYVPVEGSMTKAVLGQFASILNNRYACILVDEDDEVAAFGLVFPSIADALIKHRGKMFPTGFIDLLKSIKKPKELEMALMGVKDKYKNTGINSIIIDKISRNIIADGIKNLESNPMLETNYSIQQQWKFTKNTIIKRRQTYKKPIGSLMES